MDLFLLTVVAAACGSSPEQIETSDHAVIGQCIRNEPTLRGPAIDCAIDADCPCGSFCDTVEHTCAFECMIPPAGPTEACATGTQCDDTGRCVGGSQVPPGTAPVLTANPPALTTAPGGPALSTQVRLAAFTQSAATAAAATQVRAVGLDGAEVSCNASAFGHECVLTGWTFSFDGTKYVASRSLWVRTATGTPDGAGAVHLQIDDTSTDVVVPASASSTASSRAGDYRGVATISGVPSGVPISAKLRGNFLVIRDATRTIAPEGALAVNVIAPPSPPPAPWRLTWLRPPGATTGGAIVGEYAPIALSFTPDTGALTGVLQLKLLDSFTTWMLRLTRVEDVAECQIDADCGSGLVCPNDIRTCVPPAVWAGAPSVDNQFDDPRSAQWFNAMSGTLGVGDGSGVPAAFAATGAELIENLMCTTYNGLFTTTGHLGVTQIHSGTQPSHSGDLICVNETNGAIASPGPVGLATRYDRAGSAPSGALLTTCLQDLARPVAPGLSNLGSTVGDCVNLARALPAMRLFGTGELSKRTSIINGLNTDLRLHGLFRRLLQQWSTLHGFIATAGLGQREFEDATTATPAAARQNLLNLLDVMDAGWSALLDQRVAPAISPAVSSEDGSDDALFYPQKDYRFVKKPVAYWPINAGTNINRDIMQNLALTPQRAFKCQILACPEPPTYCQMLTTNNYFSSAYNCPGYSAVLPASGPQVSGGNMSVLFNIDPLDVEFPTYSGGTILATETLAVIETWEPSGINYINVIHPTGPGTTEWVPFFIGPLGHWTSDPTGGNGPSRGTSIAIVRDTRTQTYTLYAYNTAYVNGLQVFQLQYQNPVQGRLDWMGPGKITVGAGPLAPIPNQTSWWTAGTPPRRSSHGSRVDDVAIFNSMISKREFVRFAATRGYVETHRDAWPFDMSLGDYGTQELKTPVGANILEAQVAHLELADRLAVHMRYQAQAACDNHDATARADVDAIVQRLGRTLRQSIAIQSLVASADSDSANRDRALLGAKTSQLLRDLDTLVTCRNPYSMADTEVPLYFGSISPATDERAAFFAASDHLLNLAEQRAQTAQTALDTVRTRWDQARQSQIQQLQADAARQIRVDELTTKYGEAMIRLCGISDRLPSEVLQDISAGTFSVDTCFIKPPGPPPANTCPTSSTSGPVMDADPTCYRGTLGSALMDIRASYHAQQGAYQSWQAAIGNAEAQNRLCVLKEMDLFGCSAVDRHALSGVTCPAGHEGTLTLIDKFLTDMREMEEEKSWFDTVVHTISTVGAVAAAAVATGPGAAFLVATAGALSPLSQEMGNSMEQRKRAHEAMLQERSLVQDLRACWTTAEQYDRAIGAAEQASQEATARMQSAIIAFENAVSEGREILATAPVEIDRELNRPSIPIAFHYWLPEALETYQFAFDSARRYAYMALRAVEYDTLALYTTSQSGKPSRGALLGAWLPPTLTQQLALMRDQTNTRTTVHGPPSLGHMTFDLGAKFFGLVESSQDFGSALAQYAQPVYSQRGEYLGLGVRFSLVPQAGDESPTWRCAERIWRVNVGATGFPSLADGVHVKLLKRNLFASRRCDDDGGFQVASLRPSVNLLVASGEPGAYVAENTSSAADVRLMDFNQPDALFNFKNTDSFLNGSSSELSLQELYGDYVLLFPQAALSSGLALSDLRDFFLRFDFLSIDNTPPILLMKRALAGGKPIVVP